MPPDRPDDEIEACTLILIRHGESVANTERRFTRHDDEPLTALGIEQARESGRELLEAGFRPGALYASPYLRARETARVIGAFFGLQANEVADFREQGFGELKGRPYESYYPLVGNVDPLARWHSRAPGGESLHEVAGRVGPALDEIAARHPAEQVVVVSHGGVMAALRGYCRGNFLAPPESTENAGGYVLRFSRHQGYEGPEPLLFRWMSRAELVARRSSSAMSAVTSAVTSGPGADPIDR